MTNDPDVIAQLRQMLTDAEAREDRAGAAWARYSLAHAQQTAAQMDVVEALILTLIPTRERGALTALVIAERMPRLAAAVTQAKAAADEMAAEDQQLREQRSVSAEADERG